LSKVVIRPIRALRHRDVRELIVAYRTAQTANGVLAVRVCGRLRLFERVNSRPQAGKLVRAVAAGGLGQRYVVAKIIRPGQRHGHTAYARLAALLHAVVVRIDVDESGQARGLEFAKVVVGRVGAAQRHRNGIVADTCWEWSRVAGSLLAVDVSARL